MGRENAAANLPPAFAHKMAHLLGNEFDSFAASYRHNALKGLRVNTLKIEVGDFRRIAPFALEAAGAYEPAGFLVEDEAGAGRHPYHAAGLYYLQEPSAMAVAALMSPQPGEVVLDLAAAPGGKATHLAALMGDEGLLVANETHSKRVWSLVENLERWGVRNAIVTQEHPERLAARWGAIFDRVLVDAPCSGEGMFRRLGPFEWSQEMAEACARRQLAILQSAAELVRPAGMLVYSTCTFSPEENEAVIARFLHHHTEYQLVEPQWYAGFAPGRPEWVTKDLNYPGLRRTVRLWPHRVQGEGHFIALLQRRDDGARIHLSTSPRRSVERGALRFFQEFSRQYLRVDFPTERLRLVKSRLFLLPELALDTEGVHVIRGGLLLGEVRRGYFKPAHALAMALSPREVRHHLSWAADEPVVRDYLSGLDLSAPDAEGWTLVTVDGYPLGWGKAGQGRLKNHYPRELRRNMRHSKV